MLTSMVTVAEPMLAKVPTMVLPLCSTDVTPACAPPAK
jgi:hypothetical protein